MTLYQFSILEETRQLEVFENGVYVGRITKNGFDYECRQIEYFYVEYRIDPNTCSHLSLRTFKSPDLLQPYLERMDFPAGLL